ncbi:NUDIX hydrolase [Alkalibacillus haloalkaliphilus]|uniref:Nudix hydrolase domain-containing protein n=1 Tax=Alkalibacillus haloalkaliphilus TaxID=94136 RepID=A0A511W7X4_9BACI|nr:NUDIX hydrolase [Alkalibacillus haloalkaliphilus]GEN46153.1 hypothetical protein AHA02nite_19290 [Alkalibacillus haloalkaliphilus]
MNHTNNHDADQSVVVLLRQDDEFILINQYRKPIDSYIIQLPGGGVEQGEQLENAARRELLEETGYQCGELDYLGMMHAAPWIENEMTHVFYSKKILGRVAQQLESHETIEVITMPVERCIRQIKGSKITDPEVCYAVLQLKLQERI